MGGGSNKTTLAIEVLKSREFITKFIRKHDLLVPLMAAEGWDLSRDELLINQNLYDTEKKRWLRKPLPPRSSEPTMQEAYSVFSSKLSVSQDSATSLVSLGLEFYSPNIAKRWVDWLVQDINAEIKGREVREAKKSIEYLSGQLKKTPIADMQAIFYELIEEQTKTIMFAEVRDEYVFKTLDKAIASEIKERPKRSLIVVFGTFLGGGLGLLLVLFRYIAMGVVVAGKKSRPL